MTITIYKTGTMELICLINLEDNECIIKSGYDIMVDGKLTVDGALN